MPWSGGTFSRNHDWTTDAAASINIEASRMDTEDDNFASGINDCLHKGGQNTATGNLPMGGNKHTNVGNATARSDYASAADVMDQDLIYYVDTGSADTLVITPSPAITAYEEGQRFVVRVTNNNTGASTLNVNALGATTIRYADGNTLESGALLVGGYYEFTYDDNGSRFVLTSMPSEVPDSMLSANIPTLDASSNTYTGDQILTAAQVNQYLRETGATADEGNWILRADSDQLLLGTATDAAPTVIDENIMTVDRTGGTVDSVDFPNGSLQTGGVTVYSTDAQVDHDATTNFVANEHIDHTAVTITAGSGLSYSVGGTDISASATIDVDVTGLAQVDATDIDGGDEFLINDGGTNSALRWQDFGVPRTADTTTTPLSGADLTFANRIYDCDNAAAISAVIPANASVAYPIGTVLGFCQLGAGQVTVSVTSDTLLSPDSNVATRAQYSTIFARKTDTTEWVLSGDLG